ncbi:integrase [Mycolicibacterium neoaurum]|nr:integrase [Mycolicibacterium neoaurum]
MERIRSWQRGGSVPKSVPVEWVPLIDGYLKEQDAAGFSQSTVKLRREQLGNMAREIGVTPDNATRQTLTAWLARHREWKPETRRSMFSTLKSFCIWASDNGWFATNPAAELPKVRLPPPAARPAPDDIWHTSIARARGNPRVTLLLRLASEVGLRRAEAARVSTDDLMGGLGRAQLLVHGKGGKKRVVPISDSLAAAIAAGAAGHTTGAPSTGWLFPGSKPDAHLTPKQVGDLIRTVMPEGWSMHTLRHRFATRAYRGSRNIRAVQTLLGHASVATTERYTAVDDDEVRAAMLSASDWGDVSDS